MFRPGPLVVASFLMENDPMPTSPEQVVSAPKSEKIISGKGVRLDWPGWLGEVFDEPRCCLGTVDTTVLLRKR